MKRIYIYILAVVFTMLGLSLIITACSQDYDYKGDNSRYDNVSIKVNDVDENNKLFIDLNSTVDQISLNISPDDVILDVKSFAYITEDTLVVKIEADGSIRPKAVGERDVHIMYRGNNKVFTDIKIVVTKEIILVEEIKVPPSVNAKETPVQQKYNLAIAMESGIRPVNADNRKLKYTSENPEILTVDAAGVVTGVSVGITRVFMETTDGTNIKAECTLKIIPELKVTGVIVPKILEDGAVMVIGQNIDFSTYMVQEQFKPAQASNIIMKYELIEGTGVLTIDENGLAKPLAVGDAKIKMTTTDGTDISQEFTVSVITVDSKDLHRGLWTVTTSWKYTADGKTGLPEHMFDEDGAGATFLSISKPGKLGAPAGAECFFIIDMHIQQEFELYRFQYRLNNKSANMRVTLGTLHGSNDGTTFVPLTKLTNFVTTQDIQEIKLDNKVSYRFVKFTFDGWNSAGNTLQISEFYLGAK